MSLSLDASAGAVEPSLASAVATSAANVIAATRAGRKARRRATGSRTASTSDRLKAATITGIASESFVTDRRNGV